MRPKSYPPSLLFGTTRQAFLGSTDASVPHSGNCFRRAVGVHIRIAERCVEQTWRDGEECVGDVEGSRIFRVEGGNQLGVLASCQSVSFEKGSSAKSSNPDGVW